MEYLYLVIYQMLRISSPYPETGDANFKCALRNR